MMDTTLELYKYSIQVYVEREGCEEYVERTVVACMRVWMLSVLWHARMHACMHACMHDSCLATT